MQVCQQNETSKKQNVYKSLELSKQIANVLLTQKLVIELWIEHGNPSQILDAEYWIYIYLLNKSTYIIYGFTYIFIFLKYRLFRL